MGKDVKYRLELDAKGFAASAKQATKEFEDFTKELASNAGVLGKVAQAAGPAGLAIAAVGGAAVAAAVGVGKFLFDAAKGATDLGGKLSDVSARTGISVESLQRLGVAAKMAGGTMETASGAVSTLQRNLAKSPESFQALGLSVEKLRHAKPDELLLSVSNRLRQLPAGTQQAMAGYAVMGKAFAENSAFMLSDMQAVMDRSSALGQTLGEDTVGKLDALGDEVTMASETWDGFKNQLGAIIATNPAVVSGIAAVTESLGDLSKWVIKNKGDIEQLTTTTIAWAAQMVRAFEKIGGGLITLGKQQEVAGLNRMMVDILKWSTGVKALEMLGGDAPSQPSRNALGPTRQMGSYAGVKTGASQSSSFNFDPDAVAEIKKFNDEVKKLTKDFDVLGVSSAQVGTIVKKFGADGATEILKLAQAIGGKGLLETLNKTAAAIDIAGGVAALTWPGLQKVADQLTAIGLAGQNSALGMKVAAEQLARLNAAKDILLKAGMGQPGFATGYTPGMAGGINFDAQSSNPFLQAFGSKAEEGRFDERSSGMEFWTKYPDVADEIAKANKKIADSDPAEHFRQSTDAIASLENALGHLAGILGKGFGADLAGLGAGIAGTANAYRNRVKNMSTSQKVEAGGNAAGTAFSIWEDNKYNRSAGSGAMHGAASGAQAGAAFGPYGVVIGAVVGGIIGALSGGAFRKVLKDAGATLGGEISTELGKAIQADSKKYNISTKSSSLLHLGDFMAESGKSATEMGPQINDLFKGIIDGSIPAKQGMEQLNSAFDQLATAANNGDAAAKKMTADLIHQGIAAGKLTDSMKAFVQDALGGMAGGAAKILEGVSMLGKGQVLGKMGTAAAQMFVAGFTAQIGQVGLVQAIADNGKGIEAFYKKLEDEGNTAGAAMLAPFVQLSAAINNDADPSVKGFMTMLQGMSEVFAGLDKLGFVTTDAFHGLEEGVKGGFTALTEGGVASNTALQAIAPQLGQIIEASQRYGFTIDATTQGYIDQAKAAGVAFPTDPMQQMIGLLGQIVVLMGGTLPAAMATTGSAASDAFNLADKSASDAAGSISGSMDQISGAASGTLDGIATNFSDVFTGMSGVAETELQKVSDKLTALPSEKTMTVHVQYQKGSGPWTGPWNTDGSEDHDGDPATPLAAGGVVRATPGGRHYILGEGGEDEAVIPLSKMGQMGGMTVNVDARGASDPEATVRAIKQAFRNDEGGLASDVREMARRATLVR